MAKKEKTKPREFTVITGFDCEKGRWEIGDDLNESDLTPSDIAALLEMNAITITES